MFTMLVISLIISWGLFLLAGVFFILKDKACILINGYYFISKNKRELYDELRLSRDYSVILLKGGFILFDGVTGYIIFHEWFLWISILFFIIYFVKVTFTFRFDDYKKNSKAIVNLEYKQYSGMRLQ